MLLLVIMVVKLLSLQLHNAIIYLQLFYQAHLVRFMVKVILQKERE